LDASRPVVVELVHSLGIGGAELLVYAFVTRLSEFSYVVVCLDELGQLGQSLQEQGVPVYCLTRKAGLDWSCVAKLRQIIKRHGATIVHAHQYTPFSYALLARGWRRSPRIVFTEHGRHQPDYRRWKRVFVNRLLTAPSDRIVAVGQAVRRALIDNEGFAPRRVEVIYNGVDLQRIASGAAHRVETRASLGLRPDQIVLIHVARLDYLKDHATAVSAVKQLVDDVPNLRYVIVGDGPLRSSIEKQVEQESLQNHVLFLGTRQDIPQLLAMSDIFVLPSVSEGIPLVLIEAMAAGLPVVATAVGGVPEMIDSGVQGILVPPRSAGALADALRTLIRNPALRQAMSAAGKVRARERFGEESMLERYRELFRDCLVQR
jgi:sugar transferase (PEP-CTERM/EpsH1 system associated)